MSSVRRLLLPYNGSYNVTTVFNVLPCTACGLAFLVIVLAARIFLPPLHRSSLPCFHPSSRSPLSLCRSSSPDHTRLISSTHPSLFLHRTCQTLLLFILLLFTLLLFTLLLFTLLLFTLLLITLLLIALLLFTLLFSSPSFSSHSFSSRSFSSHFFSSQSFSSPYFSSHSYSSPSFSSSYFASHSFSSCRWELK